MHSVNSVLLITKHYTFSYKEHKKHLLSPFLGDLGENACPGKTEQRVATEFLVEYLKFWRARNNKVIHL